jgi:hypothetical protein
MSLDKKQVRKIVRDEIDSRSYIEKLSDGILSSASFRQSLSNITSNHCEYFELLIKGQERRIDHIDVKINNLDRKIDNSLSLMRNDLHKEADSFISQRLATLSGVNKLLDDHQKKVRVILNDHNTDLVKLRTEELKRTRADLNELIINELRTNPGSALVNSIEKQLNNNRNTVGGMLIMFVVGVSGGVLGNYLDRKYNNK